MFSFYSPRLHYSEVRIIKTAETIAFIILLQLGTQPGIHTSLSLPQGVSWTMTAGLVGEQYQLTVHDVGEGNWI